MKIWFPTVKAGSGSDLYVIKLAKALNKAGIATEITWFPHYFEYLPRFLCKIKAPQKYDLIHTNSWTARLTSGFCNKPMITTCHHWVHAEEQEKTVLQRIYHALILSWERKAFINANAVICPGQWTLEKIETFTSPNKWVIPNWIDLEHFEPSAGKKENSKKLLIVGSPSQRKGFQFLSQILSKLNQSIKIDYVCSRTAKNLSQLQPLLQEFENLNLYCDLSQKELISKYNESAALLNLSVLEGFGYTYAEAMACGIPVIGFKNDAIVDMVPQNFMQLLVKYANTNDLVDVIENFLLTSKYSALDMLELRSNIENRYSEKMLIDKYILLYRSVLNGSLNLY